MKQTINLNTVEDLENLPIEIEYVGETEAPWDAKSVSTVDKWRVTVKPSNAEWQTFDYFTGLGCREKVINIVSGNRAKPKMPKIADVLHSIILDSETEYSSFSEWCDDFGYSNDSIRALSTYDACKETADKFSKCFNGETIAAIKELLADY